MNIEAWERNYRSSRLQIFFKTGVFKNCANFIGKHLCLSLFSIKLQIWRLANLLRRDSNTGAMRKKLQTQSFVAILQKRRSLKKIANFTGKYLCWRLLLTKLQAWRPATLLKTDSNTGVFLWKLRNF